MKRVERFSDEQISELKMVIQSGGSTGREVRRANALLLWQNKVSEEIIESATGYNSKYIYKIRKRYLTKGLSGLLDKKRSRGLY